MAYSGHMSLTSSNTLAAGGHRPAPHPSIYRVSQNSVILVDMAITPLKSIRKGKNWHILQLRICGRICTNAPNLRRVIAMSTRITLFLGHPGVLDSWGHPVCPGYRGGGRTQGEQDAETRGRGPLRESPGDAAEVGRVYRDTCHICHVPHLLMG